MVDWPVIDQIDKLNDVDAVEAVSAGTEANRPASPNVKLLYISRDTGRVDYWNGSSWDPVGLSESEIQLGDLNSKAHSELSSSPEDAHHSKDHDHTEADISQVPNAGLANDTITVAGNFVSLGGSVSVSIADLSDAALPNATSPGQIPIWNGTNSRFENAEITGGNAIDISTADASTTVGVSSSSIGSSELVNDSVTFAGQTAALGGSASIAAENLSNIASTTTLNAGDLLIWDDTAGQFDNSPISGGNAINVSTGDASTTIDVPAGSIGSNELANDSITIASTTISLGGSATFGLSELSDLDAGSSVISNLADPTNAQEAATKSYADSVASGLEVKDSVRVATDGSNIDLTGGTFGGSIDGVSLVDGDRALIKDQATASENGIYTYDSGTNTFSRSSDFDSDSDVTAGAFTFVEEGTNNQDNGFVVTSDDPISVGTDAINFGQFSGAGQITAGTGLNKSGDTLSVDEPNVDHDNLSNFVTNEHIDHSGISISAGTGLSGGGDITTSRTIDMDIPGMTSLSASPAADDQFAMYDASAGSHKEVAYTEIESGLNHDNLSGFVANEHIDHSTVSISAGTGLSGGGDLTTSRTINMDISGMTSLNAAPATGDQIPLYDSSAGSHVEVDLNELVQGLDGDILDIDWTPSTYSPDDSPTEASDLDDLTAHLKGIDDELGSISSSGGGITWNVIDVNTTANVEEGYLIDSTGVTLTLPSSPTDGDFVVAAVSIVGACTIDGNGNNIDGQSSLEFGDIRDPKGAYLVFDSNSSQWEISLDQAGIGFDINNGGGIDVQDLYHLTSDNEPSSPIVSSPNTGEARFDWSNITAISGVGNVEQVGGGSFSSVSTADISGIDTSYSRYLLLISGLVPATNGEHFHLRFSSDGGSTFDAGSQYENFMNIENEKGGAIRDSDNTSEVYLTDFGDPSGIGNGTGKTMGGFYWIHAPADTSLHTNVHGGCYYQRGKDTVLVWVDGVGMHAVQEAQDTIRLQFDSGNISTSTIHLLGVA